MPTRRDNSGAAQLDKTPSLAYPADDDAVLAARPAKNSVDPWKPYAFLVEPECQASGRIENVATLFLTNRECPLRCTMCDLWKNTLDEPTPVAAIPTQIEYALSRLPAAQHIKLYNSGNFFDPLAVPPADYEAIARQIDGFQTVIVENHPRMCGRLVGEFKSYLRDTTQLEIALGLETVHPKALPLLNKQMSLDDFVAACSSLREQHIALRAFVLLRPPSLTEAEGVEWALRSIDFAFDLQVSAVSVIPTRASNGLMERWQQAGLFTPPSLASLETVLRDGLAMQRGRVFVDLWDIETMAQHEPDSRRRIERLRTANLQQRWPADSETYPTAATHAAERHSPSDLGGNCR
ncbi:MAG: radical SAM protein [Planctomycetales bacterium]|nr:radical SAM protein [Planctomycetales bacterium]